MNEETSSFLDEEVEQPASVDEAAVADYFGPDILSDVTQPYFNEIGQNALLSVEEEVRHARRVREEDFAARQSMIEHDLRLVVNIAKHYNGRGLPFLDLIEEGNLGLIHALEKFDPARVPLFDLGNLVDPAEHRASHHVPVPHHSPAGACDRCLSANPSPTKIRSRRTSGWRISKSSIMCTYG